MLGDKVSHGGAGLSVCFLGATRAAHSPLYPAVAPAVGLEGRGAQFIARGQVQEWRSGEAEPWRRGRQRR